MKTTLLAAAAVLALGIGSAFAGEDLATLQQQATLSAPVLTGVSSVTLPASANAALRQDSGSNEMPTYASISVPVADQAAVLVPASSGEGMVQSADSLPGATGALDGETRLASAGNLAIR